MCDRRGNSIVFRLRPYMIEAATLCVQAATPRVAGALAGQQGKPDLPSAAFHLLVAAAAGDARALRDLRCLAQVC